MQNKGRAAHFIRLISVVAACAALSFLLGLGNGVCASASRGTVQHYNVVLLTDTSGSLEKTDAGGQRFEAINQFVALLSESGNKLGCVAFGDGVVAREQLIPINTKEEKRKIVDTVTQTPYSQWTDIGSGLEEAADMLTSNADPNMPSVIILFSDGKTNVPAERRAASLEKKDSAVLEARDKGYRIYTVCLNTNSEADTAELYQISKATGGYYQEISGADDLGDVFNMFYGMIYGSEITTVSEGEFGGDGTYSETFSVPVIGIKEVNVMMSGDIEKFDLTDAAGHAYTENEKSEISWNSKTFTLLKLIDPISGKWEIKAYGEAGKYIRINMVMNGDLTASLGLPAASECKAGDTVRIYTFLYSDGASVDASKAYSEYKAKLSVTYPDGACEDCEMKADAKGFYYDLKLGDTGAYYFTSEITGNNMTVTTDRSPLNIENSPPELINNIEKHVNIWPFFGFKCVIDLSGAASDPEEGKITAYEVESSSFLDGDYTLRGSVLTMNNFSVGKGSISIRAYDSQRAYCVIEVRLASTDIGVVTLVILCAGGAAAGAVLLGIFIYWSRKPFNGVITVQQYRNGSYGSKASSKFGRGRKKLRVFNISGMPWLAPGRSYFQATGLGYIYFVPKGASVYCDGRKTSDRYKINGDCEVMISKDEDCDECIYVSFEYKARGR